jgi:AraC family transcriptional regulator
MQLFIKNMVCDRCIVAVRRALEGQGLHPVEVRLGEATIEESEVGEGLKDELETLGFELLDDKKRQLLDRIRNTIIRLVHYTEGQPVLKYSEVISAELGYEYPYLSKLFSEAEGLTLEQYILRQKTEKIKEYLRYDELNLSQIADKMGYSSVSHLSTQFRKITGMSPTEFKREVRVSRTTLDRVGK